MEPPPPFFSTSSLQLRLSRLVLLSFPRPSPVPHSGQLSLRLRGFLWPLTDSLCKFALTVSPVHDATACKEAQIFPVGIPAGQEGRDLEKHRPCSNFLSANLDGEIDPATFPDLRCGEREEEQAGACHPERRGQLTPLVIPTSAFKVRRNSPRNSRNSMQRWGGRQKLCRVADRVQIEKMGPDSL